MNMDFRRELERLMDQSDGFIYDCELQEFSHSLVSGRTDIPLLYRYMPADYFSIRGLESKTLYLSEVGKMNDFFEGLSGQIDDRVHYTGLGDLAYLKSFTESFDNLLMWGTYANCFSGICVAYDLRNMINHQYYYRFLYPVLYRNQRYTRKTGIKYLIEDLKRYKMDNQLCDAEYLHDITSMFIVKSKSWEHEAEWRIVVPYVYMHEMWQDGGVFDEDEDARLYSISNQTIEFPYATAVYMGPLIQPMQKNHIVEICRKLGIRVYESKPSATEFGLSYSEIIHDS